MKRIPFLLAISAFIVTFAVSAQQLDPSFHSPLPVRAAFINGMVVQPDGKILLGGEINFYGGDPVHHLIRLNADGSRDTAFGDDGMAVPNFESGIPLLYFDRPVGLLSPPTTEELLSALVLLSVTGLLGATFDSLRRSRAEAVSTAGLVKEAFGDALSVLEAHLELAVVEVREDARVAAQIAATFGIGAALTFLAAGFLLAAAAFGLALVMPAWLACLIASTSRPWRRSCARA